MARSRKEKIIVFGLAGALAVVTLLFGRKANAAESQPGGFSETVPGGSSGQNTFKSLLNDSLQRVDTSVLDLIPGDNNAGPNDVTPQVRTSPQRSTPPIPTQTGRTTAFSSDGGGAVGGRRIGIRRSRK